MKTAIRKNTRFGAQVHNPTPWTVTTRGGYVVELSDCMSVRLGGTPVVRHPIDRKPIKRAELREVRDREGELVGWKGTVRGARIAVIND